MREEKINVAVKVTLPHHNCFLQLLMIKRTFCCVQLRDELAETNYRTASSSLKSAGHGNMSVSKQWSLPGHHPWKDIFVGLVSELNELVYRRCWGQCQGCLLAVISVIVFPAHHYLLQESCTWASCHWLVWVPWPGRELSQLPAGVPGLPGSLGTFFPPEQGEHGPPRGVRGSHQ